MSSLLHVGDRLDLDLDTERWVCGKCSHDLGAARDNVKRGLLVAERDPAEIHPPLIEGEFTFSPNPAWVRILEFYCPGCGLQVETEYLPPGHPITHTTELDLDAIKARLAAGELVLADGHLRPAGEDEA
ncbi:MAG: acetone carboxylase subunit gamma [Gammaproteobacteria bacterium]